MSICCQDFIWPQSCKLPAPQKQPLCSLNTKEIFQTSRSDFLRNILRKATVNVTHYPLSRTW